MALSIRKVINSMTFRLWLPNAGIFLFGVMMISAYYPGAQRDILVKLKEQELAATARLIAAKLDQAADSITSTSDILTQFSGGTDGRTILLLSLSGSVTATFPAGTDPETLRSEPEAFLVSSAKSTAGTIEIYLPRKELWAMAWKLNLPVYFSLLGGLLVTMVVFHFVAKNVSRPIHEITKYSRSLVPNPDAIPELNRSENELKVLRQSLEYLKHSLEKEAEINAELTKGLEIEVSKRTEELTRKNTYLEHAARILRHDMHSGINVYLPRGINSLFKRLTPEAIEACSLESPLKLVKEGLAHAQKVYGGVYEFTNLVKQDSKLNLVDHDLRAILSSFLSTTSYKDQVDIGELGRAMVSEHLFCTAIDNLIRNGLKYNDSPTKVVIISRLNQELLAVSDNGRGMTQEEFDLFSSTSGRREGQKEAGSGLGLGICLAILQEHKFTITCEKNQSGGSTIKIKLS